MLFRSALKKALASPILLRDYAEQMATRLEFHLVQEPQLAIKVFCMNPRQPKSPPHDHGGLWGLYGTYRGLLGMSFYREERGSQPEEIVLREGAAFQIPEGDIYRIAPDKIHAVWAEADATVVLTVYNGDLNNTRRRIFDPSHCRVVEEVSRWEDRLAKGQGKQYQV